MNNNLPIQVNKNGVLGRITTFIRRFLYKTKYKSTENIIQDTKQIENNKFTKNYKIDNFNEVNENMLKENNRKKTITEIIFLIENNPEILEKLDVPKLKVIDNYYTEKIAECKRKLANSI